MAIRDEHNATNRDPIVYTFTPGGMKHLETSMMTLLREELQCLLMRTAEEF